ncbi:protein RRNAD1-like isoform X2 [Venturia canescens]|uniref:protein RRNAD1-like isoform X2 n=1 Tax=Venturia canescens TaxID=32260 RepID=UPI001C9D455D|nr:protein RRNAD1-like isoform X2 [Venturia canescens]
MASDKRVVTTCDCKVCNGIRSRLNKIFVVLETYGWLLDTYIVDFFVDNVWDKLPSRWRNILGDVDSEELGNWVMGKKSSTRVWPLSLLALQKTIKTLEINRDHENKETLRCSGYRNKKFENLPSETSDSLPALPGTKRKRIDTKHQKLFTKSVKKKKCHEVENIAQTTSECAEVAKCECIVDIGAGMGHLARTLAYNYGLAVVCLEQDKLLSQQAKIFDDRLSVELRKKIPKIVLRNPRHISTRIVESDILGKGLMGKLKNEFTKNFILNQSQHGFGLIGLHTCGDLAANLIRLYSHHNEIRFICIVGCCYMKITCGIKDTGSFGYPLSNCVSLMKNHEFSYAALEVACHAIENHCEKLITGDYHDLLVHAYRATLETILVEKSGESIRRSHLKNVKLKGNMTFESFNNRSGEELMLNLLIRNSILYNSH